MNISPLLIEGINEFLKGTYKVRDIFQAGNVDFVNLASTCLSSATYNSDTQVLTVTFTESGSEYEYLGVDEETYSDLVNQFGSIGETYNEIIKGSYPYNRIG